MFQEKYYAYIIAYDRVDDLQNLKTSQNEPFELIFDKDTQVKIIMKNLIHPKAIYSYNASPWISDVIRIIKNVVIGSHYLDLKIFDFSSISDRVDLISYMYNIIERRMSLV